MIEYPFIQGLSASARWRAIEFIAAAAAAALVAAIPDLPYALFIPSNMAYDIGQWSFRFECERLVWSFLCNGFFIALILGPLALAHLFRWRGAFWLSVIAWSVGLAAALAWADSSFLAGQKQALERSYGRALPEVAHGLLVPFWAVSWRKLAQFALPFALALATCRRSFSPWRFIAAYLAGCAIVFPLFHYDLLLGLPAAPWFPRVGDPRYWQVPVPSPLAQPLWALYLFESFAQLLLAMLLILPPLNRAAIERHVGGRLSAGPRSEPPPRWGIASLALAGLNFAALLALAAFFTRFGCYEAKLARFMVGEPLERTKPAGKANAFFLLAPEFEEGSTPELNYMWDVSGTGKPRCTATRRLVDILETTPFYPGYIASLAPLEAANEAIGYLDRAQIAKVEATLAPWLAAIERAGAADTIEVPAGRRLDMVSLQQVPIAFHHRAALRIHDGDWQGALRDIETEIRLGAALGGSRVFLSGYLGMGLRSRGHELAYRYWQAFRRDPEKLRALEELMLRLRDVDRRGYDPEAIAKASPLSWPIVPYYEAYFYGYAPLNERDRYDRARAEHDQLECALALERFRQEKGKYPDALAEIVPAYLDAVPRDPKTGKEMHYENLGEEFRLCRIKPDPPSLERLAHRAIYGLPFPPPTEMDPSFQGQMEAARKASQAAAAANAMPAAAKQ